MLLFWCVGAKVYIGCRDSELGREAEDMLRRLTGNKEVHFLSLKMGSIEEVRKFAATFQKSKIFSLSCYFSS